MTSHIRKYFVISSALFILCISLSGEALAQRIVGLCHGRELPVNRVRYLSNLHLECTSNYSTFFRTTPSLDLSDWEKKQDLSLNSDGQQRLELRTEMQRERQAQEPLIQWSGTIPYQTLEMWDWVEEVYGPHPSCGYDEIKQKSYDGSYVPPTRVMRTCWHDEPRHESRPCTDEKIEYTAEFIRPSENEWNPSKPDYLDILPNKYDLLPGEREEIRFYNTSGSLLNFYTRSTYLSPQIRFKGARNNYHTHIRFSDTGMDWAACKIDTTPQVQVRIHSEKRVDNEPTPNPFRTSTDEKDSHWETLSWFTVPNKKGKIVRSRPFALILEDISQKMIEGLAKETRVNAVDQNTNLQAFFKNTVIRVRLVQKGFNLWLERKLYTDSSQLRLDDQDRYVIPLIMENKDIYTQTRKGFWGKMTNWLRVSLKPNAKYRLYVSAYQKGVPFYKQRCGDDSPWYCRWFQGENSYFSPEISIDFETDSDIDFKKLL